MKTFRRWMGWQIQKVLPDPGLSFRIEPDGILFEELDWSAGQIVLDVGCYRGHYAALVARRGPCVIGLDPNIAALRDIGDDGIRRVGGDGQTLPFASDSFDAILCHMTANLFRAPESAAGEFVRCTRQGGRIILSLSNLRAPYHRVNRGLELIWPACSWSTLRTSQNHWTVDDWTRALASRGARLEALYSCNLCWPLVPRLRGRWIIPNRLMWSWARAVRRLSRLPLRTPSPHFAAHDYVAVYRLPHV